VQAIANSQASSGLFNPESQIDVAPLVEGNAIAAKRMASKVPPNVTARVSIPRARELERKAFWLEAGLRLRAAGDFI
jgi:hypothetical protein